MPITKEQLATITPRANSVLVLTPLNEATAKFEITTKLRLASYLSQVGHESGQFTSSVESLSYRVEALISLFGRHRISEADARKYGRNDVTGQKANQEMLGNLLYGGDWGKKSLGNTEVGDGWKFRGRGWLQITGRSNYKRCGDAIGVDLISHPEYLEQPKYAALSAAWFFSSNGLLVLADKGDNLNVGSIINTGSKGKTPLGQDDRDAIYKRALKVLT